MAISNPGAVEATYGEGASLTGIARSLEPLIREHTQALEERRIPPALVEALYDAGVFRAMLPREVGGLEAEPVEWLQMIEELTRINASAGWLAFIQSGVGLTFLDPGRFERFRERAGGRLMIAMSLGRIAGRRSRWRAATASAAGGRSRAARPSRPGSAACRTSATPAGHQSWTPAASRGACSRSGRPTRPASSTPGTALACAAREAATSR